MIEYIEFSMIFRSIDHQPFAWACTRLAQGSSETIHHLTHGPEFPRGFPTLH